MMVNKKRYTQCPVSIYMKNLETKMLIDQYLHARGTKQKFIDSPVADQTHWYYEFSSLIEGIIKETQQRQMDDMNAKHEREMKASKSKR